MRKLVFIFLFLPFLGWGQTIRSEDGKVRYGITDYSVYIGYPANWIISCNQGIDSIDLNVDTTLFSTTHEVHTRTSKTVDGDSLTKTISYAYELHPKREGVFKLNEGKLWSKGKEYTLSIADSLKVGPAREEPADSSGEGSMFDKFFGSSNNHSTTKSEAPKFTTTESPYVIAAFVKSTYKPEEMIELNISTNRGDITFPDKIKIKGLENRGANLHTTMEVTNGEMTQKNWKTYKLEASKAKTYKLKRMVFYLEGKKFKTKAQKVLVK